VNQKAKVRNSHGKKKVARPTDNMKKMWEKTYLPKLQKLKSDGRTVQPSAGEADRFNVKPRPGQQRDPHIIGNDSKEPAPVKHAIGGVRKKKRPS